MQRHLLSFLGTKYCLAKISNRSAFEYTQKTIKHTNVK